MLSAVIPSERSQPAVLLAEQLAHQRFVRPGPLVLGTAFLKYPTRAADRDRTVSRRSKPSSRAALMGEQPNPWDLLRPQDATSRHRTFLRRCRRRRLYLHPARPMSEGSAYCGLLNFRHSRLRDRLGPKASVVTGSRAEACTSSRAEDRERQPRRTAPSPPPRVEFGGRSCPG